MVSLIVYHSTLISGESAQYTTEVNESKSVVICDHLKSESIIILPARTRGLRASGNST